MLTKGWRALCDYHRLSHLTPCCPAYPSALLPPTHTQTHIQPKDVGMLCDKKLPIFICRGTQTVVHHTIMTCLKLPFFLCSQSIMSWKIGIMIFRTSVWGTRVTPRKGPIIPGMKWGLLSPGLRRFTYKGDLFFHSFHKNLNAGASLWYCMCVWSWVDWRT